jgi:hypothetical protein
MDLRLRGDIGVFDASHSESVGREWLLKQGEVAPQQEVAEIIEGLGGNQTASVEIL